MACEQCKADRANIKRLSEEWAKIADQARQGAEYALLRIDQIDPEVQRLKERMTLAENGQLEARQELARRIATAEDTARQARAVVQTADQTARAVDQWVKENPLTREWEAKHESMKAMVDGKLGGMQRRLDMLEARPQDPEQKGATWEQGELVFQWTRGETDERVRQWIPALEKLITDQMEGSLSVFQQAFEARVAREVEKK